MAYQLDSEVVLMHGYREAQRIVGLMGMNWFKIQKDIKSYIFPQISYDSFYRPLIDNILLI